MANAQSTARFISQTAPFSTLCQVAANTQDFYNHRIDPALDQWQAASDTLRALLLIPFQLIAPWAKQAAYNFLMLSAISLYTVFVVWRECSQHTWNCWLDDALEAIAWAEVLENIERPIEAIAVFIRATAFSIEHWVRKGLKATPSKVNRSLELAFQLS